MELNFDDLTPIEIPVSVGGVKYVLREATGDVACKYRNAMLACTQLGPEGKPSSVNGMADIEPLLVHLCLYPADGILKQNVPLATVRSWPSRVVKSLFEKAKEIGELDEKSDEVRSKNEPASMEAGSS